MRPNSKKTSTPKTVASNDAFVAAMNAQIKRGREKVKPGTYVDTTPPIGHIRIRGDAILSSCGSPAAMCADVGGSHSGAETMK